MENESMQQNEEQKPESEIQKCETERDEYLNGWKRAKADLANYKKEEDQRLQEVLKFGLIETLRDFIPVLDSFDLALAALEDDKAKKGVTMIRAQLADMLKRRGLEAIPIVPGQPFDPAFHESIGETESEHPPGSIVEEVEKGYIVHGRVIRASRVKLAK